MSPRRPRPARLAPLAALAFALSQPSCAAFSETAKLIASGDSRTLRERPAGEPPSSPRHPPLLVLALDGIDRALLYDMLAKGEMPVLARMLEGKWTPPAAGALDPPDLKAAFPHAYFDPSIVATFPSTTIAAWATTFSGVPPAAHGVSGNEFFIREKRLFAAPIPNSVSSLAAPLATFTDDYTDRLLEVPTIYEQMRLRDPDLLAWVSMSQFYRGADRLLLPRMSVFIDAVGAVLLGANPSKLTREVWAKTDLEDIEVVVDKLASGPVPDVLTLYLFGTDDYAHMAPEGPDVARRAYLREVVDPGLATLAARLAERGALAHRYVVVLGDHGHTEVVHDDAHALSTKDDDNPPSVVRAAGFRLRPFKLSVDDNDDFQAVLAYEGAVAYVYLADRSRCAQKGQRCDFAAPPRYDEDVVPMAEAFFKNNSDGSIAPGMKGALDLIFTRKPRPFAEDDLPFEVYVGEGRTVPIDEYLRANPHPTYTQVEARLRDLGVGPHGERAGDVLLLAHNGDRERPEDRRYFASPYHSWHGSFSHRDSDIPLIVAREDQTTAQLAALVKRVIGAEPRQQTIGQLLVRLRLPEPGDLPPAPP